MYEFSLTCNSPWSCLGPYTYVFWISYALAVGRFIENSLIISLVLEKMKS